MVLIDKDRQNCKELKEKLEKYAREAGFITKSARRGQGIFQVINRLAVEELESWFWGDIEAILEAYPKIPPDLEKKSPYRDPDTIGGGTWESLERIFKRAGYYSTGLPKIETARNISRYMVPHRNRSRSFQAFKDGLIALVEQSES